MTVNHFMPVALPVMCQKVLHHINKEDQDEFLKLANALVHKAVTKNAYEEYRTKLETICICTNCKSWCDFWHRRRFHFVSAFRGFFLPGVNLAEAGQAGMKRQQNHQLLSLVDAAYKDILAWLRQDELYKATLDNCTTEKGWVHNMAQKQADEHWAQEDRVPRYLKDLQKGNPCMEETMIDNFNDFHPENSGHDFTSTSNRGHGHGWGGCGSRERGTTSYYQHKTDRAPPKESVPKLYNQCLNSEHHHKPKLYHQCLQREHHHKPKLYHQCLQRKHHHKPKYHPIYPMLHMLHYSIHSLQLHQLVCTMYQFQLVNQVIYYMGNLCHRMMRINYCLVGSQQ